MRRAQDRSSGMQGQPQQGQPGPRVGATGAGATGSSATGARENVTRETRETTVRETPVTTTTTTTGAHERQPASSGYQRPAPGPGPSRQQQQPQMPGPGNLGNNLHGGLFSTLAGLLTFFAGLSMVARHRFYHSIPGYAYNWGIPSWGWVLVGLGIVLFASGASHLLHIPFSRILCIALATLAALAGFLILPLIGIWGIVLLVAAATALWGLLHGAERQAHDDHDQQVMMMNRQHQQQYGGEHMYGGQQQWSQPYGAHEVHEQHLGTGHEYTGQEYGSHQAGPGQPQPGVRQQYGRR